MALWAPNGCEWVLIALGALGAGAALVPVSTRFTGSEALDVIARSGARALFVAGDFLGVDRLGTLLATASGASGASGASTASGASEDGTLDRLGLVVRVPDEWDAFLQGGSLVEARRRAAAVRPAGRRQRHHVHLRDDRAEQGRDDLARAITGRGPGLGRVRIFDGPRPVPGGEPVLPHLRFQGGPARLPDAAETVARTSGRSAAGFEVRIGDAGEILLRGPNLMLGYLDDPEATKAAVDSGGWLHTGDAGRLDAAGYLTITGRLKDMYICGGFNVYPAEVEQVLARLDGVADSAVVGVPGPRLGEVGQAFVVRRPGHVLDAADVLAYCRERLANYKVPRRVEFRDVLPRNPSGKALKRLLCSLGGTTPPDPPDPGGTHPPRPPLGGTNPPIPPLSEEM